MLFKFSFSFLFLHEFFIKPLVIGEFIVLSFIVALFLIVFPLNILLNKIETYLSLRI